jgi:hypothetical protein
MERSEVVMSRSRKRLSFSGHWLSKLIHQLAHQQEPSTYNVLEHASGRSRILDTMTIPIMTSLLYMVLLMTVDKNIYVMLH